MDKARLSLAVYKKTGVALDPRDPAFSIVELNREVLEDLLDEATRRIAERLEAFPEKIRSSASAFAAQVAAQGGHRVSQMLAESRQTIAADAEVTKRRMAEYAAKLNEPLTREVATAVRAAQMLSRAGAERAQWVLASAFIGLLLFACGFVSGMAVGPQVMLRMFGSG